MFSTFFGDDANLLADLEAVSSVAAYPKGSLVFGEGDTSSTVYYVLQGEARALRYSSMGAEVFIDSFKAGSIFGEMVALGGQCRSADMYALTDLSVAMFSEATFVALMEKHGSIGLKISRLLAARIQKTTSRMFEHATLSSKGRVYAELMRMAEPVGHEGALSIRNMPSISDIAKKLSIARETVSRTVNELKDEAIVRVDKADLTIIMPHMLVSRLNQ